MEQLPMFSDAIEYKNFNQQDYYDLDNRFNYHFHRGRFAYVFGTKKISIYDTWKQRKYQFHFDENTQRFYIAKAHAKDCRRFELVSTSTGMMLRAMETVQLSTGFEKIRLWRLNVCFEHNAMYVLDADYVFRGLNDPTRYLNQLVKIWNLDDGTCRVFRLKPFESPRPRMSITDGFLHVYYDSWDVHYDSWDYERKSQTRRYPIKRPETLLTLAWFARPKDSEMPKAITQELEADLGCS
ncbi:hypothetical protein M3Y95_00818200 [Aphelenchoides besseyi]|nr:hypothetical protein M3Y95_00818200 [Aphelenchoides besseyi]